MERAITETQEQCLRMVLVGKTGAGKSATGNTILGKKCFKSTLNPCSVTSECQKETGEFEGQNLSVVDTPGLFDTSRNQEEVKTEVERCVWLSSPGPHVFLVVIQPNRFTKEDKQTVKLIQKIFGETAARYTMALFTHGDDLEEEEVSIQSLIPKNPHLEEFVRQCGGGYHAFNNRRKDSSQVRELLKKINKMVERNGGSYYTNRQLQEAERIKREVVLKIVNKNTNITIMEATREAERGYGWGVFSSFMVTLGTTAGAALGPVGSIAGASTGFAAAQGIENLCRQQ